jgi:uncharacterized membrane protein
MNENAVSTGLPVAGRSLHRWLVGLPVILFILTLSFFAVYAAEHDTEWLRRALLLNIAAVVAGGLTAATGAMDFGRMPRDHRARTTALVHGGLNALSISLLVINLQVYRALIAPAFDFEHALSRTDPTAAIALTGVALGITLGSGVLGYLLAHRYMVGLTADQLRERGRVAARHAADPAVVSHER